jgi:hypothetical protein
MAKKQKKSYIPTIIILTILVIGLGLYGFSTMPQFSPVGINQISNATGEVTLALSPANLTAVANTESILSLKASTGSVKLMVLAVEIAYDPAKVDTPTITQGAFLGNTLASPKVENGKITFTYAATPESGGAAGSGEVAVIKFKPKENGTSAFTITANSLATAAKDGERIAGNSLKSAVDAVVTVGSTQQSNNSNITSATPTPAGNTATSAPAKNDIAVVSETPTPKPTVRPKAPTPTTAPTTNYTNTQETTAQDMTDSDTTGSWDDEYTNPGETEAEFTDTTTPTSPNIFQKIGIGWSIIFQSILNIF